MVVEEIIRKYYEKNREKTAKKKLYKFMMYLHPEYYCSDLITTAGELNVDQIKE